MAAHRGVSSGINQDVPHAGLDAVGGSHFSLGQDQPAAEDGIDLQGLDLVSRRVSPDATSAQRQEVVRAFRDLAQQEGISPAVLLPQVLDTANKCDIAMRIFHVFIAQLLSFFAHDCLMFKHDYEARIVFGYHVPFTILYIMLLRCAWRAWPTIPLHPHYRSRSRLEPPTPNPTVFQIQMAITFTILAVYARTEPTRPCLPFSALSALVFAPLHQYYGNYKESWVDRLRVEGHPDEDIVAFFSLDGADEMIRLMRCSWYWIALRLISRLCLRSLRYIVRNVVASGYDPTTWALVICELPRLVVLYLAKNFVNESKDKGEFA